MEKIEIIDLTPENIADYGVCGYKDVKKHLELRRKIDWFKTYYPKGLRIKALVTENGGYQGMLEYIPGEFAHRPVKADGYMFIHCLFVGFKNEYKGKGYASALIDLCITEAKNAKMQGVAVVTRNGAFMAKKDIFLKKGFELSDKANPDFELMALKFNRNADNPQFRNLSANKQNYEEGITILRSAQCSYSVKNVEAILESAKNKYNMEAHLMDMDDVQSVQHSPCAFGTFCIIYNGEIVSYHPISHTRFQNIMQNRLK